MPAVTVDNILALPRVPEPDGATAAERPVVSVTTAPRGFEGEGFPVRRAFAGVDLRQLDPFIHMDQMGEVEYAPGRAEGHAVAPAPRLRDRHVHDRRRVRAPGLQRRRRPDHQRRHPVDDRRRRDPAHRDAAGAPGRQRRAVPRLPAVGEPARAAEDDGRRATRTSGPSRSRCSPRPTAARCIRVIAGDLAGHPGPGVTHTPITLVHATLSPARGCMLPWRPDFNALVYVLGGPGTVGPDHRPVRTGQLAVFGAGDALTVDAARTAGGTRPRAGRPDPRRAADPRAGRRLRPVRDEHAGRAGPGVRGLPGRPAGQHPRRARRGSGESPPGPRRPVTHSNRDHSARCVVPVPGTTHRAGVSAGRPAQRRTR